MRFFSAIVASLVGSAALVAAAPTPTNDIVARSCQTAWWSVARVEEAQPGASYLPGVLIGQSDGKTNRQDTFFEFYPPAGAYGCQLEAFFPVGSYIWNSGPESNRRLEVFSVAAPLSRSPHGIDISWAHCPAPISQVGSVTLKADSTKDTKVVINSFTCATALAYRFSIARDINGAAQVGFNQGGNGGGIRMVYNC